MICDIIHLLPDYILVGILGRLALINKELYNIIHSNYGISIQMACFKITNKNIKRYSIYQHKNCSTRCKECSKKISKNTNICTNCARDPQNYHAMLTREEIYPYILANANNRLVLKKRKLFAIMKRTLQTQSGKFLYRKTDINNIAYNCNFDGNCRS
tara:strand:+ start:144 stop:614 length:471 start_codon:yes stop_codon:yes gene_type:complete